MLPNWASGPQNHPKAKVAVEKLLLLSILGPPFKKFNYSFNVLIKDIPLLDVLKPNNLQKKI